MCHSTQLGTLNASRAYLPYYGEVKVQDTADREGRRKQGMVTNPRLEDEGKRP